MIDVEMLRQKWDSIEAETSSSAAINSFPAFDIDNIQLEAGRPMLAVDSQLRRHLLLPIPTGSQIAPDRRCAGVHLYASVWQEEGQPINVVDIVCLKPHLKDLFCHMAFEILSNLEADRQRPDAVGRKVISRWRELLSHDAGRVPDDAAVTGMFGEMLVLTELARNSPDALQAWVGPEGARHDFVGKLATIEVKSTLRQAGISVTINGIDQLLPAKGCDLYLFINQFERAASGGLTLSSLVDGLVQLGIDRVDILNKTSRVGFTPDVIALLSDRQFRRVRAMCYLVDSFFPCITPQSFSDSTSLERITALSYTIDLSVAPPTPLQADEANRLVKDFLGG